MPIGKEVMDYGLGMVCVIGLLGILYQLTVSKKRTSTHQSVSPDLVKVIQDNTKAITELQGIIQHQGEMQAVMMNTLVEQNKTIIDLRLDMAKMHQ
jgi:hypothetical protein